MSRCLACSQENCGYKSNCDCDCHTETKKDKSVNEPIATAAPVDDVTDTITKAFAYANGDDEGDVDSSSGTDDGYHECLDCEGEFADEDCHAVNDGFICQGCYHKRQSKSDDINPALTAMNEAVAAAIDQRPVAMSVDSTGGTVAWRQEPPTAEEVRTQQWWWNKPANDNPPHILQLDVDGDTIIDVGDTSDCVPPFDADDWPGMWAPALPPENVVQGPMTMTIEDLPENILDASDERTKQLGEQARQIQELTQLTRALANAKEAAYNERNGLRKINDDLNAMVLGLQDEIREWQTEDRKKTRRIKDLEATMCVAAGFITKNRPRQPTAKTKNFDALAEQLVAAANKNQKKSKAPTKAAPKKAPAKKKR